jgi:hypothetical protein
MTNPESPIAEHFAIESIPSANYENGERMQVTVDGVSYDIHNTHNLWGYVKAFVSDDHESGIGRATDAMELGNVLHKVQEQYPRLYAVVSDLALQEVQLRRQLYSEPSLPENDVAWKIFRENNYINARILVLSSLLFDALIPILEKNNQDPLSVVR